VDGYIVDIGGMGELLVNCIEVAVNLFATLSVGDYEFPEVIVDDYIWMGYFNKYLSKIGMKNCG
jgi:hypothetical protein